LVVVVGCEDRWVEEVVEEETRGEGVAEERLGIKRDGEEAADVVSVVDRISLISSCHWHVEMEVSDGMLLM
jgi:hypothetical protein